MFKEYKKWYASTWNSTGVRTLSDTLRTYNGYRLFNVYAEPPTGGAWTEGWHLEGTTVKYTYNVVTACSANNCRLHYVYIRDDVYTELGEV